MSYSVVTGSICLMEPVEGMVKVEALEKGSPSGTNGTGLMFTKLPSEKGEARYAVSGRLEKFGEDDYFSVSEWVNGIINGHRMTLRDLTVVVYSEGCYGTWAFSRNPYHVDMNVVRKEDENNEW